MIHLLILAVHLLSTIVKLAHPGGVHAVVAESLMLKHQLLISSRSRRRAPNLNSFDRFILALGSLFVSPVAALQEKDLANHRPPMPSLTTTLGGTIAAVCSRYQSQRNYEFAMDRSMTCAS